MDLHILFLSTIFCSVLEYVEKCEAPKPENAANHDDWVSACRCLNLPWGGGALATEKLINCFCLLCEFCVV